MIFIIVLIAQKCRLALHGNAFTGTLFPNFLLTAAIPLGRRATFQYATVFLAIAQNFIDFLSNWNGFVTSVSNT